MEFQVLGRLAARQDGVDVVTRSPKQRSLLALLLIHANEVVATDRIIDELWGDEPAGDRQNALWVHVSNLRSALEPDRAKRSEGTVLLTQAPGYLLRVAPDELDASRFERSVQEGRSLIDLDPAAASIVLGEGLALWRGRPYEDVAYEAFAQPEIARLEELRLEAVGLRVDADLRRGLDSELVGELESLVRQHPLREGFTAQLMLALHRSGRRADALRACTRLTARLGDELGVEPTASLRRLEHQIVIGDPSLTQVASGVAARTPLAVRGYEIREQIGVGGLGRAYRAYQPAVGREVELRVIPAEQADDPSFIRRFEAQAELVARLEHPHIVPLYDYWREPGAAYVVTRLLRGGSLADELRTAPLPAHRVGELARQIGSALSRVHRAGMVHGDVRPENVLIDEEQRAYLSDLRLMVDDTTAEPAIDRASSYASPERLAGALPTPASDLYSLAMVLAHALTGRTPEDVARTAAELSGPVRDVFRRATARDALQRYPDVDELVAAVQAALGEEVESATPTEPEPTVVTSPYKGLRAFEEADSDDFFGRERLLERLIARLGVGGTAGRFVALVGPSGSGKSSVVKAGLLPALRMGALPGSAEWFVVDVTPGPHPYEELEAALLRVAVDPPVSLLEELTDRRAGIRRAVRRVLPEGVQLLLVIDQFEELFTQSPPETTNAFLDALAEAVEDPMTGVRVVVTLRADFYDRPLGHRAIGELLRRGTEVSTPMSPEELERAITGPAARLGVRFEPGLLVEMVADVSDRPGGLPLLQYALTELFEHRRGSVIDLTAYRQMGGVSGALVRRAEALYGAFDVRARETARQVLLRLVTLGDGTEDLRRRVLRHELISLGEPSVEGVLDTFGRHRLLSFDRDPISRGPTVEIAHEALLSEWHRLRGWIDDARADLQQERWLGVAAAEWELAGRDDAYLLRGPRLEQMAGWAAGTDLALHRVQRDLLEASLARRDVEAASEQERRVREEHLRRTTRQRTRQLVGSVVAVAVLAAVAAFAVTQRNDADRLARERSVTAHAQRLAAYSSYLADRDTELAMLLALQSLDTSAGAGLPAVVEAEEALHWSLQGARIPYPETDAPLEVRTGPDGLTGVFRLPLAQLVDLVRGHVTRSFTAAECARYAITPCPDAGRDPGWPSVPRDPPRPPLPAQDTRPLAGTRITLLSGLERSAGLGNELRRFEEATGIEIAYEFDTDVPAASAAEQSDADLAIIPPGAVVQRGRAGQLVDLSTYVDPAEARRLVGDYLVDVVSTDGGHFAVPMGVDLKGLVWYPLPEFEAAGYAIPRSWDELIALSRRMVDDGRAPWCLGLESGELFSGWPATDWVEALVLRLWGAQVYDDWTNGRIPFDDPRIRQAVAMFGDVAFAEGFVRGGPESIRESSWNGSGPLLADPPGCWMHHQGSFLQQVLPGGAVAGVDLGYFVLPPIESGGDAPVFGGATMVAAMRDRPEVRELIRWVLTPDWGSTWAADPRSDFLPANVEFDERRCRADGLDERVNAFRVRLCHDARSTVAAGLWRFDASDAMAPELGFASEDETVGAFLQGMVDYADRGPDSVDEVLASIESVASAMRAADG